MLVHLVDIHIDSLKIFMFISYYFLIKYILLYDSLSVCACITFQPKKGITTQVPTGITEDSCYHHMGAGRQTLRYPTSLISYYFKQPLQETSHLLNSKCWNKISCHKCPFKVIFPLYFPLSLTSNPYTASCTVPSGPLHHCSNSHLNDFSFMKLKQLIQFHLYNVYKAIPNSIQLRVIFPYLALLKSL